MNRQRMIGIMFLNYGLTMINVVLSGVCYAQNHLLASIFVAACATTNYLVARSIRKQLKV